MTTRARPVVSALVVEERAPSGLPSARELAAVGVPMYESESGPVLPDGLSREMLTRLVRGGFESHDAAAAEVPAVADVVPGREVFARRGFCARAGTSFTALAPSGGPAVVYLGCGKREKAGLEELRRAAAVLVRGAGRSGVALVVLPAALAERVAGALSSADVEGRAEVEGSAGLEGSNGVEGSPRVEGSEAVSISPARDARARAHRRAAQVIAEGAVLGAYRFSAHKRDPEDAVVERVVIVGVGTDAEALSEGAARGARMAEAVRTARDLTNEPPSSMTPSRLADEARQLAAAAPLTTAEVWDAERIATERLGGLLGVARGSDEPPRLVRVDYVPAERPDGGRLAHVVLVGKGITFDSGGLSLKSAEGMTTMKTDMSGAAAVIAATCACAELGVRVRVTAIAPVTENMPGANAIKPGDVLTVRDGQTIEVLNTDAEGRLVLADALCLAGELRPDAVVDLATLTGAAVVALGKSIAGLFSNDEALVTQLQAAAARAGEPTWRLPLAVDYARHIESDVADMKNIGRPGQAGAIVAALLLEHFVGGMPWAHIDMAGPARSEEDEGVMTRGATGFGVRTLLELLDAFGPPA